MFWSKDTSKTRRKLIVVVRGELLLFVVSCIPVGVTGEEIEKRL
jgi:hypothetical protein